MFQKQLLAVHVRRTATRRTAIATAAALLYALSSVPREALAQQVPASRSAASLSGAISLEGTGGTPEGALVRIQELGVTASTDTTGQYRFATLTPGTYTVRFSYIGFPDHEESIAVNGDTKLDYSFQAINEVVVIGQRAAQAEALNIQRTADNISNVVSADQAGRFPDLNAAESLRRLPGVSVQREPDAGEGRYISIRGLDSGLNSTSINGMDAAQPEKETRRVPLDMIQTSALSKITVNKTLLPDQNSDGIGGAVEIETATAFDYNKPVLDLTVSGFYHDLADKLGPLVQLTGANRFGSDDQFGALLSVAYAKRKTRGYVFYQDEDYLAYTEDDPSSGVTPYQYHISKFDNERDTRSANLALNWAVNDSTQLMFKGSYNRLYDKEYSQSIYYEGATDEYEDGQLPRGEGGTASIFDEYEETKLTQNSAVLSGVTLAGPLTFNYSLGYSNAERTEPKDNEVAFQTDLQSDLYGYDFSGDFPQPNLTDADRETIKNPDNYALGYNDIDIDNSRNTRYAFKFDTTFEPDSAWLRFLKAGVKAERSKRDMFEGNVMDLSGPLTLDQFGVGPMISVSPSGAPYARFLSLNKSNLKNWREYSQNLVDTDSDYSNGYVDENGEIPRDEDSYISYEDMYDAYLMGKGVWGPVELIGGVRVDYTHVKTKNFEVVEFEDEDAQFTRVTSTASYVRPLPRIQLNYRASEKLIFRGAFYTSLARPEPQYISGATEIEQEDDDKVDITVGNPGLKPAYSYNFDLGVEKYFGSVGLLAANVYYKLIQKFIFSSLTPEVEGDASKFENDPRLEGKEIDDITTYTNGKDAKVYGLELNAVRQFTSLPGIFGGLGVYANFTWQHSNANAGIDGLTKGDFLNAPEQILTGAITYQKYGIEGTVAYSWRDRQTSDFSSYNTRIVEEPLSSLDLQLRYAINDHYKVFFNAVDVLNDGKTPSIDERYGSGSHYLQDSTYSGRTFTFGVNYQY